MDQEMIAYFDRHFRETSQQISETTRQISELRKETAQQFERVDARFERVDARFEQMDARFERVDARFEQMDARFEQMDARFEQVDARFEQVDARFEQVEATARQTLVLFEGLRHEVHVIAEGFLGLSGKMERYYSEAQFSFEQVKSWIEPYYTDLGRRVSILEGERARMHEDVVEAVQRLLGRPPYQPPRPASD